VILAKQESAACSQLCNVFTEGLKFVIILKVPLLDNLVTEQVMPTQNCVNFTFKPGLLLYIEGANNLDWTGKTSA
jgi:hypothetical protein